MYELRRLTVEEVPSFSVQSLKGLMEHETLRLSLHSYKSPFRIQTYGDWFTVQLEGAGDPQVVSIEHTTVGYGERAWFGCPVCERRCGKLYVIVGVFACRDCHRLTYTTCQRSGNRLRELSWKIYSLQQRLGMDLSHTEINDTPTFKPKRMKEKTWQRLRFELEMWQLQRTLAWLALAR